MINIKKTLTSAIAAGTILVNVATPAFAATTTLTVSGNGRDTVNTVEVDTSKTTTVVQDNSADVTNKVNVDANTGGNKIQDNSGGNSSVDTGNVDTKVEVSTATNVNNAKVDCCVTGNTDVVVSGNLRGSENDVKLNNSNSTAVFQENKSDVKNEIDVKGKTGHNTIKDNAGGDVAIDTGNVSSEVKVSNTGNTNSARVGGSGAGEGSADVSAKILGNGRNSDNDIELDLGREVLLVQSNRADVDNDIDVKSYTGDNDVKDTAGGEVLIDTGDVDTTIEVDNAVNFNWADVACDCLLGDIEAKIAENLRDSESEIVAVLGDSTEVFQGNCAEHQGLASFESLGRRHDCEVENELDVYSSTGKNEAKDNAGDVLEESDPEILTGDATHEVKVDNGGNVNVFGDVSDWELPEGFHGVNVTFDLGALLGWLHS